MLSKGRMQRISATFCLNNLLVLLCYIYPIITLFAQVKNQNYAC